ncbi:hypothetical protein I3F54_06990 [Streptomyces sp. MUM 2J]|nr:hypothetical protein [Streptomyces sp. MUM 2J]
MPIPGPGGLSVLDTHLLQTVACGTHSRKKIMISLAVVMACVINADAVTTLLRQATWLMVTVIILIVVQAITTRLPQPGTVPVALT